MKVYKLCRIKHGKPYPMFVNAKKAFPVGEWVEAEVGEDFGDGMHVKSKIGPLSKRPGFHSCQVPFTDWIGKKDDEGHLTQREDTVWIECEVRGNQVFPKGRNGSRTIPEGWYYFRTKAKQPFPWIISKWIRLIRILDREEVEAICRENGVTAQQMAK